MNVRLTLAIVLLLAAAGNAAAEEVDLAVVHRIKNEAFRNSAVMDHMFQLSDVHGPRLANINELYRMFNMSLQPETR